MGGRFNKLLEFIGLVDDEPDDELDGGGRPSSGQTYGGRNQAPSRSQGSSRTSRDRAPEYRPQQAPRYNTASPTRPDYDARQRRNDYQPAYSARSYDDRATAARPATGSNGASTGYRASYAQAPSAARPQAPRDEFQDEFDRPARAPQRGVQQAQPTGGNVVPLRGNAPQQTSQTVIYYLRALEECRDVINDLIDNKTVLLNLEDMDERLLQRAIDTLCGAAFALGATLRKASDRTYLIAPNTVTVASTNDTERRY